MDAEEPTDVLMGEPSSAVQQRQEDTQTEWNPRLFAFAQDDSKCSTADESRNSLPDQPPRHMVYLPIPRIEIDQHETSTHSPELEVNVV